ncbi:dimethyladenosine transferase 2, mitochondrial [Contarinia nasturtii]|uniref:dimethyladenosine transferase 2, mitochondrial n=1 Tax=Contarinia nasturtii TaxID=265458 RepID=UPI0012D46627|nr:dimethyladenosine transferase 2, mitochondrial [Contarinia nasturtii]
MAKNFGCTWSKQILKHFTSTGQQSNLKLFPREMRTSCSKSKFLYVASDETAQIIAKAIQPHYITNVPFFEVDPGPCILTRAFLQHLRPTTLALINRYKAEKFKTIQENLKLYQPQVLLKEEHVELFHYISEYSVKQQWHENIVAQLFLTLKTSRFINYLIYDIVFEKKLCKNGRVEIFAVMPTIESMKFMADTECNYMLYTHQSCMFQILFECEILAEVCNLNFLPWYKDKKQLSRSVKYDEHSFCLMRMVPKKNLFSILQPEELPLFKYFVHQCFFKRNGHIIPILEKWIPGIGITIMNSKEISSILAPNSGEKLNMYTRSGSLTPDQICILFKIFQTLPQYKTSNFHNQCHKYHAKNKEELEDD